MVRVASAAIGSIDILVNSAGIYPRIRLEKMTGDDFERVVSVNLSGIHFLPQPTGRELPRGLSRGRHQPYLVTESGYQSHPN